MLRQLVFLLLSMVIAQPFCVAAVNPALGASIVANKHMERVHIDELGAVGVLRGLASKAGVVIGVESSWPGNGEKSVFDFPGGTLAEALNSFEAQHPAYGWREQRGNIHVFQKVSPISLMDVVISYPGVHDRTKLQMWQDIYERPEVREWLQANKCRPGEPFIAQHFKARPRNRRISIKAGSMTLAELLDEVATESGAEFWAVLKTPPESPVCHLSIVTW